MGTQEGGLSMGIFWGSLTYDFLPSTHSITTIYKLNTPAWRICQLVWTQSNRDNDKKINVFCPGHRTFHFSANQMTGNLVPFPFYNCRSAWGPHASQKHLLFTLLWIWILISNTFVHSDGKLTPIFPRTRPLHQNKSLLSHNLHVETIYIFLLTMGPDSGGKMASPKPLLILCYPLFTLQHGLLLIPP